LITSTPVHAGCKKILVVEDNEDHRELQTCVIQRLGYGVIQTDNALTAIDEATAKHPDLILMDLIMPKMDGDEAIVQLKGQLSTRDIPIIICTAFGPGAKVYRALDAGAAEILYKPFTFSNLEYLLRKHVPF
jgi:CheY-like chemotaxis protein